MYESESSAVTSALKGASATIFTDSTISQILALTTKDNATTSFETAKPDASGNVTVTAGTEVVFVSTSDTTQTLVKPPANAPVVIFQGKGGVDASIGTPDGKPGLAAGTPERIVVGSAGKDNIVINDAHNTKIILGTGDSTVHSGSGHDTVMAGLGNSTIVGGTGNHTVVHLAGDANDYVVKVVNGHAVISAVAPSGGPGQGAATPAVHTDISHVQYVQLDHNAALILANDTKEAAVASLYHTAFGRDADVSGLEFWFAAAKSGVSLQAISEGFAASAEFKPLAAQNDTQFLNTLYHNTFGRAGDSGGLSYWGDLLSHGHSRSEILTSFAQTAALHIDGTLHAEAQLIGSITIVHGIV